MKRYIKYLTIAFVLLMGYSQIFTYVFLGVISTPSASIADGIVRIHTSQKTSGILENAIIEEIGEENKNDREVPHINSKEHNNCVASLFLAINYTESLAVRAYRFSPFQYLIRSTDSYIRFRAFRV